MRQVVCEVATTADGPWRQVGSVSEVESPGSMSSDGPGGRRVIIFGWYQDEPGVWESIGGLDLANDAVRQIMALDGIERLADLDERPYQLEVYRKGIRLNVRFTLR